MKISSILEQKAVSGVAWIKPSASIKEAVTTLKDRGIGTLIVSDDGDKAKGILSERDIVRALARDGGIALSTNVESIMTPNPVCCSKTDDSDFVLEKMTEGRFRHMPIVEADGKLIGVVSIGDIVKARLNDLEHEREALVDMIAGR